MFKGSLLFIAVSIPQLVFLRVLVKPDPDIGVILGFIAVSSLCTFLSLAMIIRYTVNMRRARAEAITETTP